MGKRHSDNNQKWYFDSVSRLRSQHQDNFCVDVKGVQAVGKNCIGMTFYFDGDYLKVQGKSNKCLEAEKSGDKLVRLKGCDNNKQQMWFMLNERLMNRAHDGLCVDYAWGGHLKGKLYMFPCNGDNNQKWYFDGRGLHRPLHREEL